MVPSAGIFGSIPTGCNSSTPWQTLLFNPYPLAGSGHRSLAQSPRDHLIMDLFQMPVVEPNAITSGFATAGKINMNYQIVPFTYIKRDSGIRAVLKPYRVITIANSEIQTYKDTTTISPKMTTSTRLKIDANETLKGFQDRFDQDDIFRSATEICDVPLVPEGQTYEKLKNGGTAFWGNYKLTGDNLRERPYAQIYAHLTTKSNTYRVHYRVQTLVKPKIDDHPEIWEEDTNRITGEYRGYSVIERYLDPNDQSIPDFASTDPQKPLGDFYRYRIIQSKKLYP